MFFRFCFVVFIVTLTVHSQVLYQCNFEEECFDFVFDTYWILNNTGQHVDHTYNNISGHYATYNNKSTSEPKTSFRTNGWIDLTNNMTSCITMWIYSGPGGVYFTLELAQGDDLQARMPVGNIGLNFNDAQWRMITVEMPMNNHYASYINILNITTSLDLDDISVNVCPLTYPWKSRVTALHCDFDESSCSEIVSLSDYSYEWSYVKAAVAQNYTSKAPSVDQSIGTSEGKLLLEQTNNLIL